jgi:single-strand DNA-binding protein
MTNSLTITGNLAGDPELRFTASGDAVANFTVCDTPRKFNKQSQQWEDAGETLFMRCSLWREDAELAAETLRRGQKVTVTGRIKQRSYEKDGEKRTVVEMDADSVAPHGSRQGAARSSGGFVPGQGQPADDPWSVGPARNTSHDEPPF